MSEIPLSASDKGKFPGAAPSVTLEKWLDYTRRKLNKGYYLIIGEKRKIANFYRGYGAPEACSYPVAKKLLDLGELEPVGKHFLGTIYRLKPEATPSSLPQTPKRVYDEDEEEVDVALVEEETLIEELAEEEEPEEEEEEEE